MLYFDEQKATAVSLLQFNYNFSHPQKNKPLELKFHVILSWRNKKFEFIYSVLPVLADTSHRITAHVLSTV